MTSKRQIILVLDAASPYHRKISQGVATYAHEKCNWDFHVVQDPLENLPYLEQDPLETHIDLHSFHAHGIIAAFLSRRASSNVIALKLPTVGIEAEHGWADPSWKIPYFATDNEAIGRLAAEDFIKRGLRHLAYCGIPQTRFTAWSEMRQAAFVQRAAEAGLPCSVFTGESTRGGKRITLHKQLTTWLMSLEKPVGLMACYDVRARHILAACRNLGILVPEEVAVIGVDNDELMCELTSPPLSSIEHGARGIGYQAAMLLDQFMAGKKAPHLKHLVKPEGIVTRRSSDTLAIADAEVAAAVRFIQEKACAGIRVYDVVRSVVVARSALERRFKNVMGRTIHAEIQRLQVERARQLVAATNLPLKEVAREAGFAYIQYMTTVFRRHLGETPGEYRKRSRD
jgi:LacI family transcriptional regulator